MPTTPLKHAHVRLARPTDQLEEVVEFYVAALGFEELGRFEDHAGFDGVMVGHRDSGYHLEFTQHRGHAAGRAPTQDNLLVFYVPDAAQWQSVVARIEALGIAPVPAFNPYWDSHGKTYEDPDGYRVVVHNAAWPPVATG